MADLARAARSFRPRLLLPELRNVVLPVRLIEHPHFGQTVLSDAITFSRLIFCLVGIASRILSRSPECGRRAGGRDVANFGKV